MVLKRADIVKVDYQFSEDTDREDVTATPPCFLPENNPLDVVCVGGLNFGRGAVSMRRCPGKASHFHRLFFLQHSPSHLL